VIDDHAIVLDGIHWRIHPSRDKIKVVGSAKSVLEAVKLFGPEDFDIFLLDLYLPTTVPLESVRILKNRFPSKKIIIYTCESASVWVTLMKKAGVAGYLPKDIEATHFKKAILAVFNGETSFPDCSIQLPPLNHSLEMEDSYHLAPLQKIILQLLMQGLCVEQIVGHLEIDKIKINYILKKSRIQFNVKNNVALVAKILRHDTGLMFDQISSP